MIDNPELARAFVKTSSAQQTLVLMVGVTMFYVCVPAFFINPTAGSAVLLMATSIFCLGLIYDVKLILDQQVCSRGADLRQLTTGLRLFTTVCADLGPGSATHVCGELHKTEH